MNDHFRPEEDQSIWLKHQQGSFLTLLLQTSDMRATNFMRDVVEFRAMVYTGTGFDTVTPQ